MYHWAAMPINRTAEGLDARGRSLGQDATQPNGEVVTLFRRSHKKRLACVMEGGLSMTVFPLAAKGAGIQHDAEYSTPHHERIPWINREHREKTYLLPVTSPLFLMRCPVDGSLDLQYNIVRSDVIRRSRLIDRSIPSILPHSTT
jgi:hypothetical protein